MFNYLRVGPLSSERNTAFLKRKEFLSKAIRKGEEHAIEDFGPLP
jgi:hypothetical protein